MQPDDTTDGGTQVAGHWLLSADGAIWDEKQRLYPYNRWGEADRFERRNEIG